MPKKTAVATPDPDNDKVKIALAKPTEAMALTIKTKADYEIATSFLQGVKALQKQVFSTFDPIVKKTHAAWKEAKEQFNKHHLPLRQAETIAKQKISKYVSIQEEKRHQRQLELEKKAQADAEARRQAELKVLREMDKEKEAKRLEKKPVEAAPVVAKDTVQKVKGLSFQDHPRFEIEDEAAIPRMYLTPDLKKIGQMVRSSKGTLKIPGVRVWIEKISSSTSGG